VKAQTAFVLSRMQKPQASSSFSALANVAFFRLWVAALASGAAVAADQTAARWALIHFSKSAFVISLVAAMAGAAWTLGGFQAVAGGPTGNCPFGAGSPQRRGAHAVAGSLGRRRHRLGRGG
jgi:hypothetical protein